MTFSVVLKVALAILFSIGEARVLPEDVTAEGDLSLVNQPWLLGVVGFGVLFCGIIIIFGCTNLCEREQSFKDFENEDNCEVDTRTAAEFSMYPPVESTTEALGSSPVIFEPLPDITKRGRVSNASVLRPKVSPATSVLERTDSEESIEEAMSRDTVQDKLKLQTLLSNSRNQLPRSQLQYIKELGAGYFGKVLQGEGQKILPGHKKTKVVIQMLKEEADPTEQLCFLQEAVPFREIEHQNLLKVFGQCIETLPYLVVLELCPFGDLKTYLRSHRVAMESFDEKGLLLKFAADMAAGLQALHQANYVHHDFAIRNCHLASDLTVKLGDYGLSEDTYKEDYYFDANDDPIPIRWLAPESLRYTAEGSLMVKRVTKEANIWTFGVALWETIQFGALPYSDLSNEHVLRLVIKERSIKLPKPDLPLAHIDRLYQLMQLCWAEPRIRPSLRELRIMLLHLLSTKGNSDSSAFEQKWNQLMPRRPPVIQRAPDGSSSNNKSFESDFMQLDASRLGDAAGKGNANNASVSLHDELSQAMTYGTNIPSPTKELASPANELSLEAELSLAMGSPPGVSDDVIVLERGSPEGGRQSDEEGEAKKENQNAAGIEVKVQEASPSKQPVPDIVATSTVQSNGRPDFITSTPKPTQNGRQHSLGGGDGPEEDLLSTTIDSNTSYEFNPKHRRTSSGHTEEVSLFGQRQFAAILQTVAAPSFDGEQDEFDNLSSLDSTSKSTEDLFEQLEVGEGQGTKTLSAAVNKPSVTSESEVILLEDTDPLSN